MQMFNYGDSGITPNRRNLAHPIRLFAAHNNTLYLEVCKTVLCQIVGVH